MLNLYLAVGTPKFQMTLLPYLTGKAAKLLKWLYSFYAGKIDVPLSVNSILSNVLVVFSVKINIRFHKKKTFQKVLWNWKESDLYRCSSLRKYYNARQFLQALIIYSMKTNDSSFLKLSFLVKEEGTTIFIYWNQ